MSFRQGARQFFGRRGAPTPPLPYDAEVEYLESTGTQWIDTGYAMQNNVGGISATYEPVLESNYTTIWGAQTSADNSWCMNQYGNLWWIGNTGRMFNNSNMVNFKRQVSWRWDNGTVSGNVNDTEYAGTYSGTVVSGSRLFMFAVSQANSPIRQAYTYMKIYSLTIEDNGVVVRDFIPVRFTNDLGQAEGAMYDRVSGALFRNAGTGAFTYGPDKS